VTVTRCSKCGRHTYKEKTKWDEREHWYGPPNSPICKKCFLRSRWQDKFVPANVKCDRCQSTETIRTKYGTPRWARNKEKEYGYLCWSCYTKERNRSRDYSSPNYRSNLKLSIKRALDSGVMFGRKKYSLKETIFDLVTEESAYWIGFLMADGNIRKEKTGNPRISLTLKSEDLKHLNSFERFLCCSNPILSKKTRLNDKTIIQFTLRFSSKKIAETLAKSGVVPNKSLVAKVIGLDNNRHFWRGVMDGDGSFTNRNGHEGDRIVLTGSRNLTSQCREFIEKNIPGAAVRIKPEGSYCRLYVYSYTARALAKVLYGNCLIALDRKLIQAIHMVRGKE
jgi:hypothetical protein